MNTADNSCMLLLYLFLVRTRNRNKQTNEVQLASDLVCYLRLKRMAAVFYRFQRFRKIKYSSFELVLSYILKGSFKKQINNQNKTTQHKTKQNT